MSLKTVMNPHMKNRTVMIAKGPRYVWTVFDGGEMDEDEGVMVDICISVLV
jgi:hypothetical protein